MPWVSIAQRCARVSPRGLRPLHSRVDVPSAGVPTHSCHPSFCLDAQVCARSVYQQRPQISIAWARDLTETLLAAARVLSRGDSERVSVAASALEGVRITHARHQRCRGLRRRAIISVYLLLTMRGGALTVMFTKEPVAIKGRGKARGTALRHNLPFFRRVDARFIQQHETSVRCVECILWSAQNDTSR